MLAVLLAIVTIVSHRAHTHGVLVKADANDQWSYYQAKRIKLHNIELGLDLIALTAPNNDATAKKLAYYKEQQKKYLKEAGAFDDEAGVSFAFSGYQPFVHQTGGAGVFADQGR